MSRSLGGALLALVCLPASALGAYDGDFYIITPHSTGMLGGWVYDIFYDDATGKTWVAADDPIWDEGGIASTFDGLTWDSFSNVNDELPTSYVSDLKIGPDGALWMASGLGILRFDGTTAEVAWSKANAPAWPVTGVNAFDWDSQGNLWVGLSEVNTVFGGLAKYDGSTWTVFTTKNGLPWAKPWDSVVEVEVDSQDNIWIGSDTQGAARFDGTKWTWFQAKFGQLPSNLVEDIEVEPDGTAWFGTLGGGVARLVGNTWKSWDMTNEGTLNTNDIASFEFDNDGDIWLTTFIGGAWEFNGTTWIRHDYPLGHVYGIDFDDTNTPILGGIGGMVFSDGQLYNPYAVNLSNRWLDDVLAHSDGTMWFGGGGGGVTQYDGTTWKSWNPYNEDVYPWPLATDGVFDMVEDPFNGHVFVNAINHGIAEWDGTDWTTHISTQSIEVMDIAPDGTLWAGPFNGAELVTYDGATWKQVNIPYTGYSGDLQDLAVDPLGNVWLGGPTGLLFSADDGATWFTYTVANSDLPDNWVFKIKPEPDGSGVWLGTHSGLSFFDGVTFTTYTMANSPIPADIINGALDIAPDGALWVGAFDYELFPYEGGLARFDGVDWRVWTQEDSNLPHEQIWSIEFDADGNAWVGTASEGLGVLYAASEGADDTVRVAPSGFKVNKGLWVIGTDFSLTTSNDDALWVELEAKGPKNLVSSTTINLTSPFLTPSALSFEIEGAADRVVTTSFSLKNVVTGQWDLLANVKFLFDDGVVTLPVTNPSNYVAANGAVAMLVTAKGTVAKNPDGALLGLDLVEMSVTP